MDEVSVELSSTEDNPRENNCRKVFIISPKYKYAVISVIHEKVYDIIQIEVSRKKLGSSISVAAVYRRPKLSEERDKVFYRFGGAAPNRVIKPRKQSLTPELCILTLKLASYVATHIQARGGSLNPPPKILKRK